MMRAPRWLQQLRLRPRLLLALGLGVLVGLACPSHWSLSARLLCGWNAGVWFYLLAVLQMMLAADHEHVQRKSVAQADGVAAVLLLAAAGALASLAAITLELRQPAGPPGATLALALLTVAGSWLLLPVEFALAYASLYHRNTGQDKGPHGLEFPGLQGQPDYTDFMYFAVTLAATSQTSDVAVSARPMRRLVLLHALLSFMFNTGVLALLINILAGMIR